MLKKEFLKKELFFLIVILSSNLLYAFPPNIAIKIETSFLWERITLLGINEEPDKTNKSIFLYF